MALGLIETVGLVAAVEAADAAIKSANVTLVGYELTKGDGLVTVKIEGDVGAVKAAIESASAAASKLSGVYSTKVIPRPAAGLDKIVMSAETVGLSDKKDAPKEEKPEPKAEDIKEEKIEEKKEEEKPTDETPKAEEKKEEENEIKLPQEKPNNNDDNKKKKPPNKN